MTPGPLTVLAEEMHAAGVHRVRFQFAPGGAGRLEIVECELAATHSTPTMPAPPMPDDADTATDRARSEQEEELTLEELQFAATEGFAPRKRMQAQSQAQAPTGNLFIETPDP